MLFFGTGPTTSFQRTLPLAQVNEAGVHLVVRTAVLKYTRTPGGTAVINIVF